MLTLVGGALIVLMGLKQLRALRAIRRWSRGAVWRERAGGAAMAPAVRHAEHACGVAVRRVSVDDPSGMAEARAAGVMGVPTFIGYDGTGNEVTRFVGQQPGAMLVQVIEYLEGRRCGG